MALKPVLAVLGPRDAGPGERQEMLDRAHRLLEQGGAEEVTRIDIPGKGAGADEGEGAMRAAVEPLVPALQSGSLFGGRTGVLVMDAQGLLKAEAEVVAELVPMLDAESAIVVFVSAGALPQPLGRVVKAHGETISVKKYRERDAGQWLAQAARDRKVRVTGDASAALLQRFGSDVAALAQALDLLAGGGQEITADDVQSRFRNRPDEPMWHYSDAVSKGDRGEALRRLSDFLAHGHPLQLLAFLEGDLRKRALAAAAPDQETFAEWAGAKADSYPISKAWRARSAANPDDLRKALGAVSRADVVLKTQPEALHRVTMERLTVALCMWYGGGR